MKDLFAYVVEELEGAGIAATPANTMGAGEPDLTDIAVLGQGGTPKKIPTKVTKRKRKRRKEWDIEGPTHPNS